MSPETSEREAHQALQVQSHSIHLCLRIALPESQELPMCVQHHLCHRTVKKPDQCPFPRFEHREEGALKSADFCRYNDPVALLYTFAAAQGADRHGNYRLSTQYPRRVLENSIHVSFQQAGLTSKQETVLFEPVAVN